MRATLAHCAAAVNALRRVPGMGLRDGPAVSSGVSQRRKQNYSTLSLVLQPMEEDAASGVALFVLLNQLLDLRCQSKSSADESSEWWR